MEEKKYNIPKIKKEIKNTWKEGNYLKCHRIATRLIERDPENKIALEYEQKLQSIDLDAKRIEWEQNNTDIGISKITGVFSSFF